MPSKEVLKNDSMWAEALERLELMEADLNEKSLIQNQRVLGKKIVVNHKEKSVRRADITDEELEMIKKVESSYDFIVYYLIEDEGLWPDGCTFKRYTMPYVSANKEEYEMYKEFSIKQCGTCPAYVANMEEPDCSEITEFKFYNVGGMIINVS